ncbi:MAG: nucleotidyl transferase AbiEii/AbiGii toxin family protein [Patescibacteria group bacterium]
MHLEALTKTGREIFPILKNFSEFYLAGGTALALQLGHRVSADFDLFSGIDIPAELLPLVQKTFDKKTFQISVNNREELTVFINGVKITFLNYPFPVLEDTTEYEGLKMLGVSEIATTKAYTIGRRGSFKDYVDLYFAVKEKIIGLDGIIKQADKKYGGYFNGRLFLEQLVYLNDIEDTEIIFLKETVDKNNLEEFFVAEIKKIKFD